MTDQQHLITPPQKLVGGPCDGQVLPQRYWDAPRIQMPIRNPAGFATYAKDPKDASRFLFDGFTE